MTLCDAGPLIAIVDPGQGEVHRRCVQQLHAMRDQLITTWPCITEAMHLVNRIGGWSLRQLLCELLASDAFAIHTLAKSDIGRLQSLMGRYQNLQIDLADASLFVTAEQLGIRQVFTLDNDFRIYRFDDGNYFEVVPD